MGIKINKLNGELISTNDTLSSPASVDTAFTELPFNAITTEWAYDAASPNKVLTLAGNTTVNLTGTVNGDSGILALTKTHVDQTISFSPGVFEGTLKGIANIQEFISWVNIEGTIKWIAEQKEYVVVKSSSATTNNIPFKVINFDGTSRLEIILNESSNYMDLKALVGGTIRFSGAGISIGKVHFDNISNFKSYSASATAVEVNTRSGQTAPPLRVNDPSSNTNGNYFKVTPNGVVDRICTTAERDAFTMDASHEGAEIYNTTLKKKQFWNGTAWETITSAV